MAFGALGEHIRTIIESRPVPRAILAKSTGKERDVMNRITRLSRRRFLATSAAGGALLAPSWHASAEGVGSTADVDPDGPSVPFPIPWLDKNGSHNQPAGPDS